MTDFSQPGIFNAADYGMYPGRIPTENASALQAAIDAAQASANPNGAIVLIPSFTEGSTGYSYGNYDLEPSGAGPAVTIPQSSDYADAPLLICGTGIGTELNLIGNHTMFKLSGAVNVTFQDLLIHSDGSSNAIGFDFENCSDCKLFRVHIADTNYPIQITDSERTALLDCLIAYENGFLTATAIVLNNATDFILSNGLLKYGPSNPHPNDHAIYIDGGSGITISNTQITGFASGIEIYSSSGVCKNVSVINATIEIDGPCISIDAAVGATVYNVSFVGCHFQASNNYADTAAGISIGNSGDSTNSSVDTVTVTSCRLFGNAGISSSTSYGLLIASGRSIQINGGTFSGNGLTGGITVAGGCEIQINGANCIGFDIQAHPSHSATELFQLYGIQIKGGSDIQIAGVNCSGNGLLDTAGAGISIAPASGASVENVRIVGAICTNPVFSGTTIQEYGIYIYQDLGSVTGILIQGCTLTGNSVGVAITGTDISVTGCDLFENTQGINVNDPSTNVFIRDCNVIYAVSSNAIVFSSSGLTNVQVTDCSGYNDQQTVLLDSTSLPTGLFSGVTYGYYGPVTAYIHNALVSIDSSAGLTSTGISSAAFPLAPQESAETFATLPMHHILIIGT